MAMLPSYVPKTPITTAMSQHMLTFGWPFSYTEVKNMLYYLRSRNK